MSEGRCQVSHVGMVRGRSRRSVQRETAHDVRLTMCALPYVRSVWDHAGERAGTNRESGEERRDGASSGREKTMEGGVNDQFGRR